MQKQPLEVLCKKRCSKKIRKIHRKISVPESLFLIKLQAMPAILLKKRLWHRCFPVNFAKFLRRPFFNEYLQTTSENETDLKEHKIFSSSCEKFKLLQILKINVWRKIQIGRWTYIGSLSLNPDVLLHKTRGLRRGSHIV